MKFSTLHEGQKLREYIEENDLSPGVIYKKAGICRATLYVWYNDERLSIKAIGLLKKAGIVLEDFIMDGYVLGLVKRIRELEKENAILRNNERKRSRIYERGTVRKLSGT
jgi:hypothetical protein